MKHLPHCKAHAAWFGHKLSEAESQKQETEVVVKEWAGERREGSQCLYRGSVLQDERVLEVPL